MDTMEEIVKSLLDTKREGMYDLLSYMEQNGFYTSPCSGGYHLAVEGGLAKHSLNVMHTALDIADVLGYEDTEAVTICALLHDLGKMGQFDKPNYVPNVLKGGKKSEAKPYKTNPDLLPVDHEIRSVAIAAMFIDLTEEEQFAILYHNGMYGNLKYALQGHETPLYLIIHMADMWASRVIEEKEEN